MAFSHDIIHQIGGQNDTNKNTTQRILLLLESMTIGKNNQAYERVIKGVINRYLEEDNHLLTETELDTGCRVFFLTILSGFGELWLLILPANKEIALEKDGAYATQSFECLES